MLFIFDENFPTAFVKALEILDKADKKSQLQCKILHTNDFMGKKGSTDEEIIIMADQQEAIIVTHDSDFKRIKT